MSTPRPPRIAKQISARSLAFVSVSLVLVFVGLAASFALSYAALEEVGRLAGLAQLSWVVPIGIDVHILISTCALAIARARFGVVKRFDAQGKKISGQPRWYQTAPGRQKATIVAWVSLSAVLNGFHALSVSEGEPLATRLIVTAVGLAFTAGILTASETALELIVQQPEDGVELAHAKTRLANAPLPVVAASAGSKPVSLRDQDLAVQVADALAFSLDAEPVTNKAVAEKLGVSVSKVSKIRRELAAAS